jgi:hypothetical protein
MSRLIKKLKDKKFQIEIIWCGLGGLGFVVLTGIMSAMGRSHYLIQRDIFSLNQWDDWNFFGTINRAGGIDSNVVGFIFGFIITAILIWSIKTYKKL